jgi:hypothetical protein
MINEKNIGFEVFLDSLSFRSRAGQVEGVPHGNEMS